MERTDFEQWKAKEVARLLALVETERRYYQEMVASLPVALVVLAADRSIVSANRAFRQTFGVRTEDLRRKTIEQILPSSTLVEKIRDVHVHGLTQPRFMLEMDDRTLRVAILPIRNWDEEGEIETLLMLDDVTGVATAPIAVAPAAVVPAPEIPAIVWQADAATLTFTSVSGATEQLLGFPASHWLSTPQFFRERIHPEDRAATMAFYEAAILREGEASAEYRAVAMSGSVMWCRETIRVTQRRTITGVLTDITLRRQLEEQLLTAERADALHGLASKLAHDLNNPLMIITGYGEEMLQTMGAQDPMRDDVQQILGATERISGITGQLLNYSRRLANPPQPVNVNALLAQVEEKIVQQAGESVTVHVEPSAEPVWTLADVAQLEEAILAFTSSGREDAKERSRIFVSCGIDAIPESLLGASLKPGVYARISIRDDGRGLDPAKLESLFESTLTAKDDTSQALARAYANVREWGGDIAVWSELFRGSAFSIYLPYHEVYQEPVAETVPSAEHVEAPAAPPAAVEAPLETILLVEDEAGIRALVRKILRREHYGVIEAGTAEEALNMAQAFDGRIDLLLTDVMLPGIGGRELAETMRAKSPDLKIVYVSGYTSDEAVRAGDFPPGSKFLQKPFTLSSLVRKVREALE